MTHEGFLFPYIVSLLGVLFGLLVVMVGWVGAQINKRLDALTNAVTGITAELVKIDRELRSGIHDIDARVSAIEAVCEVQHGVNLQQGD